MPGLVWKKTEKKEMPIRKLCVLKLIQEDGVNGNPDQIDKEPGHHKKTKRTGIYLGSKDHMTNGTVKII